MSIEEFVDKMVSSLESFQSEVESDDEREELDFSEDTWFERWCDFLDSNNE